RHFAHQAIFGRRPMLELGEPVVVDHDQYVVIGMIAANRIIDPVAARIAPIEDDLEDAPLAVPVGIAARVRGLEFLEQDAHDLGKLALLGWREMIKAGLHMLHPERRRAGWQAYPARRVSKPWPDEPGQARMEAARPDAERVREIV